MQSKVDVVVALGPIYDKDEQEALYRQLPVGAIPCRVLIDEPPQRALALVELALASAHSTRAHTPATGLSCLASRST